MMNTQAILKELYDKIRYGQQLSDQYGEVDEWVYWKDVKQILTAQEGECDHDWRRFPTGEKCIKCNEWGLTWQENTPPKEDK